MWDGTPFEGAKIALLKGQQLLVYLRDDKPDIPWPGAWDLPGGGRESGESPLACALRELREEFGLSLSGERIVWARRHALPDRDGLSWFFAAEITDADIAAIAFGDEGQGWALMAAETFVANANAVDYLRRRVAEFLDEAAVLAE